MGRREAGEADTVADRRRPPVENRNAHFCGDDEIMFMVEVVNAAGRESGRAGAAFS